jgi:hypothetical protein
MMNIMSRNTALYVPLQAKPGKEADVAEFLKSALPLVEEEPGTLTWFRMAVRPISVARSLRP